MNENFVSFGSARVMISNITPSRARELADRVGEIQGVSQVTFDSSGNHYRSGSALLDVNFDAEATDPRTEEAMAAIRTLLDGYDVYVDTTVGVDVSAELTGEMTQIVLVAAVIIVVVLILTSKAYMEVPVLLITFLAAALLNMGTNYLCGKISFISNAITVVLQLALAIDYAIILCHRFSAEHETLPSREACVEALSKSIPEICSSSLTTISGLGALAFMHFGIGLDMAVVLIKAILLSLLTMAFFSSSVQVLFFLLLSPASPSSLYLSTHLWREPMKESLLLAPSGVFMMSPLLYCNTYSIFSSRLSFIVPFPFRPMAKLAWPSLLLD